MRRLVMVLVLAVFLAGVASGVGAKPGPYKQVVDNSMEDRFAASGGWKEGSRSDGRYGRDYYFARPGEKGLAKFKVEIPETGDYTVYARWPENRGYNKATPVGIKTASGMEWEQIDQRRGGGRWVEIGTYELEAGDDYYVRFSRDSGKRGYVAADAVKVVEAPDREPAEESSTRSGTIGEEVVEEAATWMDVPYLFGGPADASRSGVDCSGLVMLVYQEFGISLPDDPEGLYQDYGHKVSAPEAGDLLFFSEDRSGRITHLGIATGDGGMIHASSYWGEVSEAPIESVEGYMGARRIL